MSPNEKFNIEKQKMSFESDVALYSWKLIVLQKYSDSGNLQYRNTAPVITFVITVNRASPYPHKVNMLIKAINTSAGAMPVANYPQHQHLLAFTQLAPLRPF
jgi:hypothetical protein